MRGARAVYQRSRPPLPRDVAKRFYVDVHRISGEDPDVPDVLVDRVGPFPLRRAREVQAEMESKLDLTRFYVLVESARDKDGDS